MAKNKREEFQNAEQKKLKPEKEVSKNIKNRIVAAYNYISENYEFRYNTVTLDVEYRKKGGEEFLFFDDRAYRDIDLEIALAGFHISERYLKDWVYGSKLCYEFDPFREYINRIAPWDGKTDHFKHFLEQVYLKDEDQREFFIECFTKWFVAYVGGLVDDFTTNQTCFTLVSKQGRFKTTFLNLLVPKELRLDYLYSSTFIAHNKDHEKYLATKMLINLDEMQAFNRSDIESIKSKITQDRVVLRLPYAKADIKAFRRASFVGSVNRVEFLNDATGTRRFLPFEIDNIALDWDYDISRLYAQAIALFKNKYKFYFDPADIEKLEVHNDPHKDRTMEEEFIQMYFVPATPEELKQKSTKISYLTPNEIADRFGKKYEKANINNTVKRNLGVALQGNGFQKVSVRLNDKPRKVWAVKEVVSPDKYDLEGMPLNSAMDPSLPI